MFRKAHLLFTLLCAGTTSAIMILMSLLYLHVSENSLYENQFHSFQNDIGTIATGLEDETSLSIQWLTRIEAQNHYIIYVMDNGVPFLYNALHDRIDSNNQKLLSESLEAYQALFEVSPSTQTYTVLTNNGLTSANIAGIGKGSAYSGIWHTEYEFDSPSENNTYYCSLIDIERSGTTSQIIILSSLRTLDTQVFRQRVLFACLDFAAVVLFCVFSWFFTGRLLKPLRENHEAQMQFIAAASHELRTPLSVILASSECCQSASIDEQRGFFQTIRNEGKRMERLIDDMLTLARLGANRFSIEQKPVQLDTLCLNAYEAFEPLCQNKDLTLHLILPEEALPRYQCDASRIAQVLSILLHNALSYTPENGQITLELVWHKDNGCFEISVTDNGVGISDADKKHIFERFYRAEKSRSTKGHFGLGLSIAYEIVAAHHGKISVTDNPGGGSVFTVRLG
ncbi:MAG: HAMP domain-containing histidine kinase [Bacillus sp. (in: Bacteria)]|nr:HAMP domain-containing histidine kinase [Bacillus sp. (in: firmicutes)]MCM1426591.1 HAMP domain-containing histidine kinase [Eubacterium sp.]